MNGSLHQPWWVMGLRGVAAVAFGILALLWPGITLLVLVTLFAAYALIVGAASIFGAVEGGRQRGEWGLPLLLGVFSLGAGAIAFMHPGLTTLVLVLLIGAYALVVGILDIVTAARYSKTGKGMWLLALNGLLSVVFGALIFLFPGTGALALVWLIALYALMTGCLLLGAAYRARGGDAPQSTTRERRVNPDRRRRVSGSH